MLLYYIFQMFFSFWLVWQRLLHAVGPSLWKRSWSYYRTDKSNDHWIYSVSSTEASSWNSKCSWTRDSTGNFQIESFRWISYQYLCNFCLIDEDEITCFLENWTKDKDGNINLYFISACIRGSYFPSLWFLSEHTWTPRIWLDAAIERFSPFASDYYNCGLKVQWWMNCICMWNWSNHEYNTNNRIQNGDFFALQILLLRKNFCHWMILVFI